MRCLRCPSIRYAFILGDSTSYEEGLQVVKNIENLCTEYPLAQAELDRGTVDLQIRAVIGDTMLTRASWMFAQKLSSMDLYASCIAILALCGISIAVQSAGVLTDATCRRRQSLQGANLFPQRRVQWRP